MEYGRFKHLALLVPGAGNLLGLWVLKRYRRHLRHLEDELEGWRRPLGGAAPQGEGSIVLLGASITAGFDTRRHLADADLVNAGVAGHSAGQLLLRFRQHVLSLRPRAVVIKLCSLNFTGSYDVSIVEDSLLSMVDLALSSSITPLLATVIPVSHEADREEGGVNQGVLDFNARIADIARARGLVLVDYHSALADGRACLPPSLGPDGVHPSEEGYRRLAVVLREALSHIPPRPPWSAKLW